MAAEGLWRRLVRDITWTPPTSTELGVVAKSALAAGLAWWVAEAIADVPSPVLAPMTALVVVQVSVRASARIAIQRSGAVMAGVLVALGVGNALPLNGLTVALLVAASLGIAQLVLRLPPSAAQQVPISVLFVLAAATSRESFGWLRAVDTLIGATVGVIVSLALPASRVVDASQTLSRLSDGLGGVLTTMGSGLRQPWHTEQTEAWRRESRTVRDRLVDQATEAIGTGREVARWNVRDRRHVKALARYEEVLPRFERSAINVWVIARTLDAHARMGEVTRPPMPALAELLVSLGDAIVSLGHTVLGAPEDTDVEARLDDVATRRERCVTRASLWARSIEGSDEGPDGLRAEAEWLSYASLLVQVDRIVVDLRTPLP